MDKPKFKVGDEVIILDKTFTFTGTVHWYGLKVGSNIKISYIYDLDKLRPEEIIHANGNKYAYSVSGNNGVYWESDLEFKNEPANETIRKEIEKRIKILEDRFHVDIKWTGTKRKRSL